MRENTPPTSPHHEDDEDLVYVGDDIDEVIDILKQCQTKKRLRMKVNKKNKNDSQH